MTEELRRTRDRLLAAAFLFDDPASYRAGVEAAFAQFPAETARPGTAPPRTDTRSATDQQRALQPTG